MDIDDRLHRIPAAYRDPREIEKRMHRDYDVTQRASNIFLVNGRSFPFTLRDSPILVKPDQRVFSPLLVNEPTFLNRSEALVRNGLSGSRKRL